MKSKYKYKLNMLEPGTKMCKVMLILLGVGTLLLIFNIDILGIAMLITAGILFLLLLILLAMEQHQDNMLYLEAKKNDPEIK